MPFPHDPALFAFSYSSEGPARAAVQRFFVAGAFLVGAGFFAGVFFATGLLAFVDSDGVEDFDRDATVVRFVAPAQATEWTADANRIRAVLAC